MSKKSFEAAVSVIEDKKTKTFEEHLRVQLETALGHLCLQTQKSRLSKPIKRFIEALLRGRLLYHKDKSIKQLSAACCLQLARINASKGARYFTEYDYRDLFRATVDSFLELRDTKDPLYIGRTILMLTSFSTFKLWNIMIQFNFDELLNKMFNTLFSVTRYSLPCCVLNCRDSLPCCVPNSMRNLMVSFLKDVHRTHMDSLLGLILEALHGFKGKEAQELAMAVITSDVQKLAPLLLEKSGADYHKVFYAVYCTDPSLLDGYVDKLKQDILSNDFKAENLLGDLLVVNSDGELEGLKDLFNKFLNCWSVRKDHYRTFRSEINELVSCGCLFARDISIKDKVENWVKVFSGFNESKIHELKTAMGKKKRIQDVITSILQDKLIFGENDPSLSILPMLPPVLNADDGYKELKKQLGNLKPLMNAEICFSEFWRSRKFFLEQLKTSRFYDFLSVLSMQCSSVPFNEELVKGLMSMALNLGLQGPAEQPNLACSCMDLLVMVAEIFPSLVAEHVPNLEKLLVSSCDEDIIVGALRVLVKLASDANLDSLYKKSMDRCIKGSRKLAKNVMQALSSRKRLHDKFDPDIFKMLMNLEINKGLPARLESLRYSGPTILKKVKQSNGVKHIISNILKEDIADVNISLDEKASEGCLLKVYGVKTLVTLVKNLLPENASQQSDELIQLLQILRSILTIGDTSETVKWSIHVKFASLKAVLSLSSHFKNMIPIADIQLAIRFTEVIRETRELKLFSKKMLQHIKKDMLPREHVCAFLAGIPDCKWVKPYLIEVIQIHSTYTDNSFPYFVYALAHRISLLCGNVDSLYNDIEQHLNKLEPVYKRLRLFISVVLYGDGLKKPEVGVYEKSLSKLSFIFKRIKISDDKLHKDQSSYSHIICDLGLSIIKDLMSLLDDDAVLQETETETVMLPEGLYVVPEQECKANTKKTCLISDAVLKELTLKCREIDYSEFSDDPETIEAGTKIKIWWNSDSQFYDAKVIEKMDADTIRVKYADGLPETVTLSNNIWRNC